MACLYQRAGSKRWWLGYRTGGRQFLKSTGTSDRREAESILGDFEALATAKKRGRLTRELYESLSGSTAPKVTLRAAIERWLKECQATSAASTLRSYSAIAGELASHLKADSKKPLLAEISAAEVKEFLAHKMARTSAATANYSRKVLRVFFRWAVGEELIRENPLTGKGFKVRKPSKRRRPFTIAELGDLLRVAPDQFWRYMVLAGFYSGLRLGDLATMQWRSVDLEADILKVRTGKTDTEVSVPIHPALKAVLASRKADCGDVEPDGYLWPEAADQYRRRGAAILSGSFRSGVLTPAGLVGPRSRKGGTRGGSREASEVSFHSLRHSFVTFLKAGGGSQSAAKALAGHSSDMVSDAYTSLPLATLQAAVASLPDLES